MKPFEEYEKEYKDKDLYHKNISLAEYVYKELTGITVERQNKRYDNSIGFGKVYGEHSYNNEPTE
jgi:hypothetical protein